MSVFHHRYHRHYHSRHRFGRHHLVADVGFVVAILALIGVNAWLLLGRPTIFPSNVRLTWDAPSALHVGDTATFTLRLKYDGSVPLTSATVALQTPETFRIDRVEPGTYDATTRTLMLPTTLAPGASSDVTIAGVVVDAAETLDLRATFHGTGAGRSERATANAHVPMTGIAFAFDFDAPRVAQLGQTIAVRASYGVVPGASPTWDAKLFQIVIDGPLPHTTRASYPGGVLRSGEVRWPFQGVRVASEAIEEGLWLTLPTSVDAAAFPGGTRFRYVLTPTIVLAVDAYGQPIARVVGSPREIEVAGELRLSATARYFAPEGDQVGRGPLPPRVGQTTKYWVTWEAQSFLRDADRVVVRAKLPDGVEWTGRVMSSVGEGIAYDAETRTVIWTLGRIERTIGDRKPDTSVSFELALTPTAVQVGASASLLEETIAEGVDGLGTALRATAPAVTTELIGDRRAQGKGRVE